MKIYDDKDLIIVLRFLIRDIKQKALMGIYPVYDPEKIVIISKNKIKFNDDEKADNLNECLRKLGATLYHLSTGESEFSKPESYQIDGYTKPAETELWPIISKMVSGNAISIPEIEEVCSFKNETLTRAKEFLRIAKIVISGLFLKIKFGANKTFPKVRAAIQAKWQHAKSHPDITRRILMVITEILALIVFIWYIIFNTPFSSLWGMLLFSAIFIFLMVGITHFESENEFRDFIFLPSVLMLIFVTVFVATSFVATAPKERSHELTGYDMTITDNYCLLVSRRNGEFVARLPVFFSEKEQPASYLAWNSSFINHFKYEVVTGIPLREYIKKNFWINGECIKGQFIVEYSLPADKQVFASEWKKYGKKENVEKFVNEEIEKALPRINERFQTILSSPQKAPASNNIPGKVIIQFNPPGGDKSKKSLFIADLDSTKCTDASIVPADFDKFKIALLSALDEEIGKISASPFKLRVMR
jgi:hypothetical protein